MLVLSRKKEQSIVIDGQIVVTVIGVRGEKVQLGIRAPKHIPVHRSELYAAIQNANDPRQAILREPYREPVPAGV